VETFTQILLKELAKRKRKNSSYSLRAFARDISISETTLSLIFRRKRVASMKMMEKALGRLKRSPGQVAEIVSASIDAYTYIDLNKSESRQMASHWCYLGILSLAELKDFECRSKWVAKRLNISEDLAEKALKFLLEKQFLISKGKRMVPSGYQYNLGSHHSVRKVHRSMLKRNFQFIGELDDPKKFQNSDFSSMLIVTDAKQIAWAKDQIKKFRRKISKDLQQASNPSCLVGLSVQLVPLTET
jgi:transcriptional regulator with XRE-family HTH domain